MLRYLFERDYRLTAKRFLFEERSINRKCNHGVVAIIAEIELCQFGNIASSKNDQFRHGQSSRMFAIKNVFPEALGRHSLS
jgi:hypothetical protein